MLQENWRVNGSDVLVIVRLDFEGPFENGGDYRVGWARRAIIEDRESRKVFPMPRIGCLWEVPRKGRKLAFHGRDIVR